MSSNRPDVCGPREDDIDRFRVDWTQAPSVSMAVVDAVADAVDVDPLELDPLNEAIDPDALDALFPQCGERADGSVHEVSLQFNGCHVTVRDTGEVVVRSAGPAVGS